MRPSDRTIRDVLRTEAARVPVPDDMWQNISRQLDQDETQKEQRVAALRPPAPRFYQWRPAVMFAAAAGVFYLTFVPPTQPAVIEYADVPAHEQLDRPSGAHRVQPVARTGESIGLQALNRREYERQIKVAALHEQIRRNLQMIIPEGDTF